MDDTLGKIAKTAGPGYGSDGNYAYYWADGVPLTDDELDECARIRAATPRDFKDATLDKIAEGRA